MAAEVKNKKKSQAAAVWRRLKKNKMAILGLVILSTIILLAIFADVLFDYDTMVIKQSGALRLKPPGFEGHLLGTDEGRVRNILARYCTWCANFAAGCIYHHCDCNGCGRSAAPLPATAASASIISSCELWTCSLRFPAFFCRLRWLQHWVRA